MELGGGGGIGIRGAGIQGQGLANTQPTMGGTGGGGILADALNYFNDVDDDEILRLYEQAIAIIRRLEGSSSVNVAVGESSLGIAYHNRAMRAQAANDLDRCIANLELAIPRYREPARIFRVVKHVDSADRALRKVAQVEENIQQIGIAKAAATRG